MNNQLFTLVSGVDHIASYEKPLREIFFEASSVKTFRDEEHRESFFYRWLGVYLEHYPEQVFLAVDPESQQLLGYLCYHTQSPLPAPFAHPGTDQFMDLYLEYPVHLHINCHHLARAKGVGQGLVHSLLETLSIAGFQGVHLLTSPDQANVRFYQKCGFDFMVDREFKGMMIRFMGKKIKKAPRPRGERD